MSQAWKQLPSLRTSAGRLQATRATKARPSDQHQQRAAEAQAQAAQREADAASAQAAADEAARARQAERERAERERAEEKIRRDAEEAARQQRKQQKREKQEQRDQRERDKAHEHESASYVAAGFIRMVEEVKRAHATTPFVVKDLLDNPARMLAPYFRVRHALRLTAAVGLFDPTSRLVQPSAETTVHEVKGWFKKLALHTHPDKGTRVVDALRTDVFQAIHDGSAALNE